MCTFFCNPGHGIPNSANWWKQTMQYAAFYSAVTLTPGKFNSQGLDKSKV